MSHLHKIFHSKHYHAPIVLAFCASVGLVMLTGFGFIFYGGNVHASLMNVTENTGPVFSTLIPDQAYVIKDSVNYKLYYSGAISPPSI